jgi:hypothetical protein
VPPDALEPELVPPEPLLLVLLPPEDVVPPDDRLLDALPPELDELPPLPAELLELFPLEAPPEELLLPPLPLFPLLPALPLCWEFEELLEPAEPTFLLLEGPASLLHANEPRPDKARKAETNGAPYLEFMAASLRVDERDLLSLIGGIVGGYSHLS